MKKLAGLATVFIALLACAMYLWFYGRPASKAAPSRQGAAVAAGDEVVDGGRIQ